MEGDQRKSRAVVPDIGHNSHPFFLLNLLSPKWCLLLGPLLLLKFRPSTFLGPIILPNSFLASSHHSLPAPAPNFSTAAKLMVFLRHKSSHVMSLLNNSSMLPIANNFQSGIKHHLLQDFPCCLLPVGPGE